MAWHGLSCGLLCISIYASCRCPVYPSGLSARRLQGQAPRNPPAHQLTRRAAAEAAFCSRSSPNGRRGSNELGREFSAQSDALACTRATNKGDSHVRPQLLCQNLPLLPRLELLLVSLVQLLLQFLREEPCGLPLVRARRHDSSRRERTRGANAWRLAAAARQRIVRSIGRGDIVRTSRT